MGGREGGVHDLKGFVLPTPMYRKHTATYGRTYPYGTAGPGKDDPRDTGP